MYDIYSEPLRKPNLVYIYICVYVCVCEYGGLVAKLCPTLVAPWTVAFQAPLSVGFCRQDYWSGLPFPSPGDLPNPGIEPGSPESQADSLATELQGKFVYKLHSY